MFRHHSAFVDSLVNPSVFSIFTVNGEAVLFLEGTDDVLGDEVSIFPAVADG